MAKISIIIPVFNCEQYIGRCIDSILNQSFKDFEIIIVNDCTPDSSMEKLKKYTDNRIKIFSNKENSGTSWTRKIGYMNATGDYLMFCDSDDWLPEHTLEKLYNSITLTDSDIVVGDYNQYLDEKTIYKSFQNQLLGTDREAVFESLLTDKLNQSLWGKIFKSSLVRNYDNKEFKHFINSEDAYLLYQVINRADKILHINESVYCYFINQNSSSRRKLSYNALDNMAFFNSELKILVPNNPRLQAMVDRYISYTIYQWMLPSTSFKLTTKALKKYNLMKYLSLGYSFNSPRLLLSNLKILLKSLFTN